MQYHKITVKGGIFIRIVTCAVSELALSKRKPQINWIYSQSKCPLHLYSISVNSQLNAENQSLKFTTVTRGYKIDVTYNM